MTEGLPDREYIRRRRSGYPTERIGRLGGRGGIPLTDDERAIRHARIYGEMPMPAERIGRPGGRGGVPLTDDERAIRHAGIYGATLSPDAWIEEMGRRRGVPLSEREIRLIDLSTYGPGGGDQLPAPLVILAWIVAHKLLLTVLVIAAAAAWAGLSIFMGAREQYLRRNLPLFQLIIGEPLPEDIDDPEATYTIGVAGVVPGRKVQIKFGKGTAHGFLDPVFKEEYGDENGNFMIDVTARELMDEASRSGSLVGRLIGAKQSGDIRISMYAQEERTNMSDLQTPIEQVEFHVPTTVENVAKAIGWACPTPVTIAEAEDGFDAGRRYQLRMAFPFLCALGGVPYVPGMWVPPGWIIVGA